VAADGEHPHRAALVIPRHAIRLPDRHGLVVGLEDSYGAGACPYLTGPRWEMLTKYRTGSIIIPPAFAHFAACVASPSQL
jgi:hypothetical protein